jgi:ABC-2 type transport system permease protein
MRRAGDVLRVLRYAVLSGYYDYQTIYTWRTWVVGWYVRVLSQVAFFALIGKLLHSPERTHYLLVGNAMLLAASGSLVAVASTQWERWAGTLPLLVAAPSSHVVVFAGRSLAFVADAVLTSLGAFFAAAAIFGLPLPWPRVLLLPGLVVSIAVATYALAIFLGGCALRAPGSRNVVSNLATTTMMAVAGVNVPVSFYPAPVHALSYALPLTFGLRGVRGLLGGASGGTVVADVAAQLAIALGWLALALLTFDRFGERGRRTGAIDFS